MTKIMKYIPVRLIISLIFMMVFLIGMKTGSFLLPFILGMVAFILLLIYLLLPFFRKKNLGMGQKITLKGALGTVTNVLEIVLVVISIVFLIAMYILFSKLQGLS